MPADFVDPEWCRARHVGYVLSGEMDVDFDGEVVRYRAGDGILIPGGEAHRHKATVVSDGVTLFLVEDAE